MVALGSICRAFQWGEGYWGNPNLVCVALHKMVGGRLGLPEACRYVTVCTILP
jgi:hypothetical protein